MKVKNGFTHSQTRIDAHYHVYLRPNTMTAAYFGQWATEVEKVSKLVKE